MVSTGSVLAGRYRLRERIGRGGMADVFRSDDEVLHRQVAVKVFRFDTPAGQDRRRIDAEVHILAGLRHPGLVTVFDAGSVQEPGGETTPFLVMELIIGETLSHRLANGPLSPEQTALLGTDMATTLDYIHENGVVHRDIKPANILLDAAPVGGVAFSAKLADFGIARLLDSTRLTMHGMAVGTANYLSPEQATGNPAGPPSDVYSLGLVLIECLTGEIAYPGIGIEAAVARLHRRPTIPTWVGQEWTRLLTAMTSPNPDDRLSAADVAHGLARLETGAPRPAAKATAVLGTADRIPPLTAHPPTPIPARRRHVSRRAWMATIAVLAALAVALFIILAVDSTPQTPAPNVPSTVNEVSTTQDSTDAVPPPQPTVAPGHGPATDKKDKNKEKDRNKGNGN